MYSSNPTFRIASSIRYGRYPYATQLLLVHGVLSFRHLIDTHQRGSLSNLEFALGMYLIQAIKTCQLTTIPTSIPSHILVLTKSDVAYIMIVSHVE